MNKFNSEPDPSLTDQSEPVWPFVIKALNNVNLLTEEEKNDLTKIFNSRNNFGIEKYGVPLSTFNGRNPIKDAFEESLDLLAYVTQSYLEDDNIETKRLKKDLAHGSLWIVIRFYEILNLEEKYVKFHQK